MTREGIIGLGGTGHVSELELDLTDIDVMTHDPCKYTHHTSLIRALKLPSSYMFFIFFNYRS